MTQSGKEALDLCTSRRVTHNAMSHTRILQGPQGHLQAQVLLRSHAITSLIVESPLCSYTMRVLHPMSRSSLLEQSVATHPQNLVSYRMHSTATGREKCGLAICMGSGTAAGYASTGGNGTASGISFGRRVHASGVGVFVWSGNIFSSMGTQLSARRVASASPMFSPCHQILILLQKLRRLGSTDGAT